MLAKDKPPILGLIQRGGQVVLHMLANVQQTTIKPIIEGAVAKGTLVHTDEYSIYRAPARLGLPAQDRLPWTRRIRPRRVARTALRGTAFARCTSTRSRASGRCCAPGCVRTEASRKTSCRTISASSSSCTTRAGVEKPCSAPLSLPWSGEALHHPGSRQEPSVTDIMGAGELAVGRVSGLKFDRPLHESLVTAGRADAVDFHLEDLANGGYT